MSLRQKKNKVRYKGEQNNFTNHGHYHSQFLGASEFKFEILTLVKHKVLGMLLLQGSPQSHTSILVRSTEIPCIVGVHDLEKLDSMPPTRRTS